MQEGLCVRQLQGGWAILHVAAKSVQPHNRRHYMPHLPPPTPHHHSTHFGGTLAAVTAHSSSHTQEPTQSISHPSSHPLFSHPCLTSGWRVLLESVDGLGALLEGHGPRDEAVAEASCRECGLQPLYR